MPAPRTAVNNKRPNEETDEATKLPIKKMPRKDIAAKAAAEEEKEKAEAEAAAKKVDDSIKPTPTAPTLAVAVAGTTPMPTPAPTPAAAAVGTAAASKLGVAQPPPIIYKEEDDYEDNDDGAVIPEESDASWNQHLFDLLMYKHQYKTLHVQATYDPSLQSWADTQRKLYRRQKKDLNLVSEATKKRILALDAINFPFTLRGAAHWERYFAKLQDFNKKHGHCLVPRLCEFAGLGDWVIDQRRQYKLMMQGKPSVLDPERQRKLEALGFVWVVRNRPEWNNRYSELLAYKEKHGDTKVPQHYKETPGLGKWVAKQREQFRLKSQGKHSFLTPDRLEKLNQAGFVWSVRKDDPGEALAIKKEESPIKEPMPSIVDDKAKEAEMPGLKAPGIKTEAATSDDKKDDKKEENAVMV